VTKHNKSIQPYQTTTHRTNVRNLLLLTGLVLGVCAAYLLIHSYPEKPKLFQYILSLRIPTLIVMLIASFSIGSASIIFQSIINNRIVTPCLLGMNSMYTLVHTAVVFAVGSGSIFATNSNLSFAIDLIVMSVAATFIYSFMFQKTGNNVLYVLLIGTVLSSFFGSIQSTMIRVMDPNEYDALLTTLVADFNNVNAEVIAFSSVLADALALLTCYVFGTGWNLVGYAPAASENLPTVLCAYVLPFLIPDIFKLVLALLLSRRLKKHLKFNG